MSKNKIKQLLKLYHNYQLYYDVTTIYCQPDRLDLIIKPLFEMLKILNPELMEWIEWYHCEGGQRFLWDKEHKEPAIKLADGTEIFTKKQFIEFLTTVGGEK